MIPMIDWLSVTVDIEEYDKCLSFLLPKLEILKERATVIRSQQLSEKVLINIGGDTFEVKPTGTASYAYILHNDLLEVRFAKVRSRSIETYPIYVHFKSEFLWLNGPENCWLWFLHWIENNLGSVYSNKVNRVDLCCHVDSIGELNPELFRGRYCDDNVRRSNREISGIDFGSRKSGNIFARIYNKTLEIKKSRKSWFNDIWEENKLNSGNITNIEFELNRNFFRNALIGECGKIDSCEQLFDNLKSLWKYCTEEWLVMFEEICDRSERAETSLVWVTVQKAFDAYKGEGQVSRTVQKQWKKENILPSALGYLTSFAACIGESNPEVALRKFMDQGENYFLKKGKAFEKVVTEKISLMG